MSEHALYVVLVRHDGGHWRPVYHRDGGGFTLHQKAAAHHPHGHLNQATARRAKAWVQRKHPSFQSKVMKAAEFEKSQTETKGEVRLRPGAHWPDDEVLMKALHAVAAELKRPLLIYSGLRTYAEQVVLYQRYLNGTGNLAAVPGTSQHEQRGPGRGASDTHVVLPNGSTVCLGTYNGGEGYRVGRKHGLHWSASGECWHVSIGGPDRWHA